MQFEWDAGKAASNLSKHGIGFTEAMTVFNDALEVMIPDPAHSGAGLRFVSVGVSEASRLLVVAYTESQMANPDDDEDMLPEYDFSSGVRGKHHEAYKTGTNVIFLEPDIAKVFKDSDSVNRALRLLLDLANESAAPNRRA